MYANEQTDQIPREVNVGDEKPEKTEKKVRKEKSSQISAKEKSEIKDLLAGAQDKAESGVESPADKAPDDEKTIAAEVIETEKKVKKENSSQISAKEKSEIKDQLAGMQHNVETAEEVPADKAPGEVKTGSENKAKKTVKKKTGAKEVKETEKKSPEKQISNSEQSEIRGLLSGAFSSAEEGEGKKEVNYEDLNKQELVETLEELVEERDINKIKNKLSKIKSIFHKLNREDIQRAKESFVAEGGNPDDFQHVEDPLEKRFNAAFSKYRHNKARYAEDLEKEKQENLQVKLNILEELKELINSEETLKKTYDEFRNLQDRWKEVGMVPAGELNNLWQSYHFLVEMFFDKVRINKELRDLDLKKNLELKIKLCESAEELFLEKSLIKSFKLLQKYHDEWREVGPVPRDMKDALWERFKAATDKINERRKEYYKTIQEEQQRNYEAKLSLCDKLEEIEISQEDALKEWQKKTNQVNELFRVWKTIGRAPKNKNDEVWRRFRKGMDAFFEAKREYFNNLKEHQTENLNLKIELCIKAESLKDSSDWRDTTNELIGLQKEWKKIGPVPRRHSDKVWKRFRAACDTFFNRKSEHFKSLHGSEKENLKQKEELIHEITSLKTGKDRKANLDALKSYQRKWMEIGHVPFKEKERLQQEYRKAIDEQIEKMDINKAELSKAGYEEKIEFLKNDPNSGKMLSRERAGLQSKIRAISDEIALWENNITFFASSKKSEQLKQEFEKKIEKARQEVEALEERLQMLKD